MNTAKTPTADGGEFIFFLKKNLRKETEEVEVDAKGASSTGNIICFFSAELRTLLLLSRYEFGTSKQR
jgi:hypothetical protein